MAPIYHAMCENLTSAGRGLEIIQPLTILIITCSNTNRSEEAIFTAAMYIICVDDTPIINSSLLFRFLEN